MLLSFVSPRSVGSRFVVNLSTSGFLGPGIKVVAIDTEECGYGSITRLFRSKRKCTKSYKCIIFTVCKGLHGFRFSTVD